MYIKTAKLLKTRNTIIKIQISNYKIRFKIK